MTAKPETAAPTLDNAAPGSARDQLAPAQEQESATAQTADDATLCPVVGIGASAGGLEALEALTQRLTAEGMAFVIVQHLAPGHESVLTTILARGTTLNVVTVQDGLAIEVNHIYVAPPSVDVAIHQGVLRLLAQPADRHAPHLSIDAFLRSLAADCGTRAIGVILSGAGTDGTLGLKAIQEAGGITFVQEPSTAGQSSMPQSALDAGCADFCLSPTEIADELMRLSNHPYVVMSRPAKLFDADIRSKLFILLRGAFGVDFGAYKQPTIERRIERRMVLHRVERLDDYLKYVQANAAELSLLYSDLLIGVTKFFRDQDYFDALKSIVFPRMIDDRNPELPIRVWVAGCATGEEAYSIAISIIEYLGERASNFRVQIFATDIEEQSLARARLAVYPQTIKPDISPERLRRFFSRTDKGYQVQRAVRDMVTFARHNLAKDPPFSRIDLVTCRNVMIYLQAALQKRVLRHFHYSLNARGFLFLGTSESVGDGSDLFSLVDRKAKIYTKKDGVRPETLDLAFAARTDLDVSRHKTPELRPPGSLLQIADRKVLEQYGPPGVVLNELFDILHFRGKTGRFFEPTPGIASINLLKLARPELLPELRTALHKALAENVRVVSRPIHPWQAREFLTLRLDVTPLPESATTGKTLLVLFVEEREEEHPERAQTSAGAPIDAREAELERELMATREYLQTTNANFQAANEELQSANEELQSANEELQSTNEELETSKEELQSTNEELVTLNEELHNRMAQLNITSDDLQNVFASTLSALILVGMDLRIRRFSSAAEKLLNLIPADVGRPLAYLRGVVKARDIEETVSQAINTTGTTSQKVRCNDGHWYSMRITPYRTADHLIRGAVIEFVTSVTDASAEPNETPGEDRAVLACLPEALALLDDRLCITWGNQAFLQLLHVDTGVFGRPFEDVWGGVAEQPSVWKLLESAAVDTRAFHRVRTTLPFGEQANQSAWFSARRLLTEINQRILIVILIVPDGEPGDVWTIKDSPGKS